MSRPRKNRIALSDKDLVRVNEVLQTDGISHTLRTRCLILLSLDENHGEPYTQEGCASYLKISRSTVSAAAALFVREGLDSVLNIKRNDNSNTANLKLTPDVRDLILTIASQPVPAGKSKWSASLLKEQLARKYHLTLGRESIRKVLRESGF